jgi:hypothetical protein
LIARVVADGIEAGRQKVTPQELQVQPSAAPERDEEVVAAQTEAGETETPAEHEVLAQAEATVEPQAQPEAEAQGDASPQPQAEEVPTT